MATEMMTVEQLNELEALEKSATVGPWAPRRPRDGYCRGVEAACGQVIGSHDGFPLANATLAAASRNALPALLAAARAHLELVSALEHLRESERAVLAEWYRQPGEAEYALCPETILKLALKRGWQSPTAKGGNDE
jgi:hypothetical protein